MSQKLTKYFPYIGDVSGFGNIVLEFKGYFPYIGDVSNFTIKTKTPKMYFPYIGVVFKKSLFFIMFFYFLI